MTPAAVVRHQLAGWHMLTAKRTAPMERTFVMTVAGRLVVLCPSMPTDCFQTSVNCHWIHYTFHLNDFVAISERNSIRVVQLGSSFLYRLSIGHCITSTGASHCLGLSKQSVYCWISQQTQTCKIDHFRQNNIRWMLSPKLLLKVRGWNFIWACTVNVRSSAYLLYSCDVIIQHLLFFII